MPETLVSPSAPITTTAPATGTAPPGSTTPAAALGRCTASQLDVRLGDTEGTAGTVYRALVFTNTGQHACTIHGFPGVSFVAGDQGRQVGRAAAWVGPKGPVVTLKPRESAAAPVGFVNVGNYDPAQCQPTPVRGLRVYPPHDTAAEFVPFPTTACAGAPAGNHLTVRTVHQGPGLA